MDDSLIVDKKRYLRDQILLINLLLDIPDDALGRTLVHVERTCTLLPEGGCPGVWQDVWGHVKVSKGATFPFIVAAYEAEKKKRQN